MNSEPERQQPEGIRTAAENTDQRPQELDGYKLNEEVIIKGAVFRIIKIKRLKKQLIIKWAREA